MPGQADRDRAVRVQGVRVGAHVEQGRGDGGLGQPVRVQQPGARSRRQRRQAVRGIRGLAAGDHQPQVAQPPVAQLPAQLPVAQLPVTGPGRGEQPVPVGGGQVGHGDPLPLQVAEQLGRGQGARGRQHHGRPAGQRDEYLLDRGVDGERGELQHPVPRPDLVLGRELADDAGQAAVADRDGLGLAGGSRGADDVGQVIRPQYDRGRRDRGRFGRPVREPGGDVARAEQPRPGDPRARRQDRQRARLLAHPGQPGRRERRIEGQVPAARFHDREHAADGVGPALEAHADQGLRAGPEVGQVAGEPAGRLVELAVGQPRIRADEGDRTGMTAGLPGHHLGHQPDRMR